jgi:uncharacterized protein (TIRG00374 family)
LSWGAIVLALVGRTRRLPRVIARFRPWRELFDFLRDADPRLSRSPSLLWRASLCQLAIFLLDAATVFVLARSLGTHAAPVEVFASFMFANLLRSVSLVAGGLGTFEAVSVLSLHLVGIPVAVALAATLLLRALSFWLPMPIGIAPYRRVSRRAPHRDA